MGSRVWTVVGVLIAIMLLLALIGYCSAAMSPQ